MAAGAFNIALGAWAYYATLPAASDSLVAVPLETTGLATDATLKDYDTLADLLAGSSNEQTTMGRKTLTGVTVTVDDTGDKRVLDFADVTWVGATGNAVSKVVFCYKPDSGSADSAIVPLFFDDMVVTPSGGDVTYQVHVSGLAEAA